MRSNKLKPYKSDLNRILICTLPFIHTSEQVRNLRFFPGSIFVLPSYLSKSSYLQRAGGGCACSRKSGLPFQLLHPTPPRWSPPLHLWPLCAEWRSNIMSAMSIHQPSSHISSSPSVNSQRQHWVRDIPIAVCRESRWSR